MVGEGPSCVAYGLVAFEPDLVGAVLEPLVEGLALKELREAREYVVHSWGCHIPNGCCELLPSAR
jgi:hypothetical protein